MPRPIKTYQEFWPYYLREHAHPATRAFHYIGVVGLILVIITSLMLQNYHLLWLMPVVGYGFAWFSHFTIEKNKPATFDYPIWSLISDFRMFYCWLAGRMDAELRKTGIIAD